MARERRRVVVTGMGAVTPMGSDVADTWKGLVEGRSAVDYTTLFDASTFPTTFSGQVRDESVVRAFDDEPQLSHAGRNVKFALTAAREAYDVHDLSPRCAGASPAAKCARGFQAQ